ncbi:MAG: TTC39/IML2 family protein [Acidobacteriia bacterium]|nr:TTC39/IML2 family protein [Terriglobia bacterium]
MRLAILALLISSASGADLNVQSRDLYDGWLKMYDLKFDDAHQVFGEWKQSHPADALGPASDAAAYLFSELARLGVLESELFTDDARYQNRAKPKPDPQLKPRFDREIDQTDHLADAALQSSATDPNALFAKSLTFGLRADLAALVEKQDFAALKYTKLGRPFADRLKAADPKAYDAYLGVGVENYLLSLKPAPLRALLWVTGSQVDREKGLENLRMTAQYGHYLEPFAKLLLAVAALRDNNRALAKDLLSGLHNRFPNNPLYLRELNRLTKP